MGLRIKVRLSEDNCGDVTLSAVSATVARAIGESNAYDGSSDVFVQEARWEEWTDALPRSAFYGRGKRRGFNNGAVFMMDEWTFRCLVGGQSG